MYLRLTIKINTLFFKKLFFFYHFDYWPARPSHPPASKIPTDMTQVLSVSTIHSQIYMHHWPNVKKMEILKKNEYNNLICTTYIARL